MRRAAIAVVFAATALAAGCSTSGAPRAAPGRVLGSFALGVNVAAWDSIYQHVAPATIADLLKAAGLALLRYPGGGWADEYDWSTDTDSSKCTGTISSACTEVDPLNFTDFAAAAHAAGASTFITVNYGSGTPSEAAAWVRRAATTTGEEVTLWEVGNETYSCYETNDLLAGAPTYVNGYTPDGPVCPSTAVLARSYAVNVLPFLEAMKRASPKGDIKIGVPWAFNGDQAAGAGIKDASLWNAEVLRAVKGRVSFVDAHWYPFNEVAGLSDEQILESTRRIPAAAAQIRSTLHEITPGAGFVVGETNISERETTLNFQPVSALFAAATSLTWLAQGAESVDWWDLNNFGSPTTGDYGLVSSGSPETQPEGTPLPAYYGELLASKLTAPGARVQAVRAGSTKVMGFQSDLGRRREILLVNAASTPGSADPARWFAPGARLETVTYSAATADQPNPLDSSTTTAGRSLVLPAESIEVLTGTPRP